MGNITSKDGINDMGKDDKIIPKIRNTKQTKVNFELDISLDNKKEINIILKVEDDEINKDEDLEKKDLIRLWNRKQRELNRKKGKKRSPVFFPKDSSKDKKKT